MIFFGMRVAFASALAGTVGLVWILSTKLGLEKAMFAGLGMAGTIPHSKQSLMLYLFYRCLYL